MARPARREAEIGLSAISIEGGLISPEQVMLIAATTPDQKAADDYGCPKGVSLRDEITRYFRIGQAHWQDYARIEAPNVIQAARFAQNLLRDAFGFDDLKGPVIHRAEGHTYRIALEARDGRVPIVVAAPLADPKAEAFTKTLPEMGDDEGGSIARRSPAGLLQAWLNTNPDFFWGLVFAGDRVRLMRDNASLTRAAHIEADLGAIFRDEMFADFTALWLLIHTSRFGPPGAGPADCALERWREAGHKSGTAARERLRVNVEEALLALGQGLIDENPDLAKRMSADGSVLTSVYEQLLRIVYRLIFLAVAEARDLLHVPGVTASAQALYADSYGFAYLRERAARRAAHDHHHDAWEGARIVFRALERGERALGLPGLGGLFAAGKTPDLDGAILSNRSFLTAIFRLSWLIENGRRVRINWRDMATEELGSVYEGLLELVPQIVEDGRTFGFAGGDEARGNARKTSGSYYTPDSLVQALLDSALNPLLERAEAEGGAEAILALNIIDPACGSGHFLLGAARRMATRVAQLRNVDAPDYQAAMRDVVRGCVHGVDRNPMAVELAKVALWIEAIDPGKPLGFLDTNIRCGDSLFGVFDLKALEDGIPDAAYKPLTGDDKEAARVAGRVNRQQRENRAQGDFIAGLAAGELAREARKVLGMPENTVTEMNAKAEAFRRLRAGQGWGARKLACDLYVAAFLRKKQFREGLARANSPDRVPTTLDVRTALSGQPDPQLTALAVDLAEEARAFHWPLEFPDVFECGGFDLVIGNPPWERIKLQEKEFFAQRDPEIAAAGKKAERQRLIDCLAGAEEESPRGQLFQAFERAKRTAEAASEFARVDADNGGRFALTGTGDVNTYALFAELFADLAGPAGRSGVIVPTGIATDATTAPFFAALIQNNRLSSLYSFFEVRGLFPGTDDRNPFCLLTIGQPVNTSGSEFSFQLPNSAALDQIERRFILSQQQIARINPNTRTAPIFRSREDARLMAKIYDRVPVLIEDRKGDAGNPWGVRFMAMFHMSNDSGLFRTAAQLQSEGFEREGTDWAQGTRRYVPLLEAKMIHQFDHRWATYEDEAPRDVSFDERQNPDFEASPRYWVPEAQVTDRLFAKGWDRRWMVGWRRNARNTDERTMIATPLVTNSGIGDSAFLINVQVNNKLLGALLANLNTICFDAIVRQKVSGANLSYYFVEQFPVLLPSDYTESDLDFIVSRVLELTYTSHSMAPFARDFGYEGEPYKWDEDRRAQLRAELDAWYARAYGLSRDELRYILDPADVMGPDYPSETFRVLKEKEIRKYGEYRTQRLVLAAWDAQEVVTPERVEFDPSTIPDEAWVWPAVANLADIVPLQLAAVLGQSPGGAPEADVRLAALFALEPRLLTPHLSGEQRRHWRRLVGATAEPLGAGVSAFSPQVHTVWGQTVDQMRAAQALVHSEANRTWSAGPALSRYVIPVWAQGRARFVHSVFAELKREEIHSALPNEDLTWVRGNAAA